METQDLRPVEIEIEKETFKGFFHGWTQREGGYFDEQEKHHSYIFTAAVVENEKTGKVDIFSPENIRFLDR